MNTNGNAKIAVILATLLLLSAAFAYWFSQEPQIQQNGRQTAHSDEPSPTQIAPAPSYLDSASIDPAELNSATTSDNIQLQQKSPPSQKFSRSAGAFHSDVSRPEPPRWAKPAQQTPLQTAVNRPSEAPLSIHEQVTDDKSPLQNSQVDQEPQSNHPPDSFASGESTDSTDTADSAVPAAPVGPTTPRTTSLILYPEFWLWIGSGANYQYYQQSIPSVDGDSSFQNIKAPTSFARAGFQGENFGVDLSYKQTPGEIKSSKTISVQNGNYRWETLSSEVLYRLTNRLWNLRFGVQHHQMPFMVLDTLTSTVTVTSNTLSMLTAGFDRTYQISEKLRGEWQMRYQHPLLAGAPDNAKFKVSSRFAFDGSIGAVYRFNPTFRGGVFWYGQWHSYGFHYESPSGVSNGDQTLFYSNLELRFGLEF